MTTQERYEAAVASLTEKLQKDRCILAAVLFGSLAYDTVWEKSDIDLFLIGEESVKASAFTLTEDEISIHASLMPRSEFRRQIEKGLSGWFLNSTLTRSRLLFSRDPSLALLWENAGPTGERDRQAQLLQAATWCLPTLAKAQKWFTVKRDWRYTTLYLLHTAEQLARVEIIDARESPGREVLQHALRLNPEFFATVYTDLLDGPRDEAHVGAVLAAAEAYLEARIDRCFRPLLEWLAAAGGPRGAREINEHFERHFHAQGLDLACDWLADRGVLERVPVPIRLTKDSRVTVDEAGYAYSG